MHMNIFEKLRWFCSGHLFAPIWSFLFEKCIFLIHCGFEMYFSRLIITDVMVQLEHEVILDVVIAHVITGCRGT